MAHLDDLISRVEDGRLRQEMERALAAMKRRQRFGLVYEDHLPEIATFAGLPVEEGALVERRDKPGSDVLVVETLSDDGATATVAPEGGGPKTEVPVRDLLVARRFGEPIYPALTEVGKVRRGADDRPSHAVINGENYHALQLLLYAYEGQVDCLYLDPPYNTGARDWKYNNRYVDSNDGWRHSKWLSMMERRLRLARRLLKPDGVLIVTIDEHEVHHLGVLLEQEFPDYLRYVVTIVISARGNYKLNFSRVEEYAMFVCPTEVGEVISGSKVDLLPESGSLEIDFTDDEEDEPSSDGEEVVGVDTAETFEPRHARRRGPDSARKDRPSMFYPIYIDEQSKRVVSIGEAVGLDEEPDLGRVDGLRPIWPIDAEGVHRRWRWGRGRMEAALADDKVQLGRYNKKQDSWTINIMVPKSDGSKKIKTVWRHTSHDAGTHGTVLIDNLLGERGRFPFPKSVYAVRDCLAAVLRDRPKALVVDVFAGSGTTFHATALLNAEDDGQRRCVLVTNNEVREEEAKRLAERGHYRGDSEFEALGIFEHVTRPRVEAVVTGKRPDGSAIPGTHVSGRPFSQGFPENVSFYRLDYLDPDSVDMGHQYDAIAPLLWLAAGGIGEPELGVSGGDHSIPAGSTYAVLFRESRFRGFAAALAGRPDVTHVWLVTDSEAAYAEMRAGLPRGLTVGMLYRDYLRNFKINASRPR